MVTEIQLIVIKWLIYVAFIITIVILMMVYIPTFVNNIVFAQNVTAPPPVTPTPTIVPTPTSPTPNPQYLPQKAYVQLFAPENGIPSSSGSLPVLQPVAPSQTVASSSTTEGLDIGNIISLVVAGGSGLLAKMGIDKAKKAQDTTKENSSAIVNSKTVQQELARLLFEWNKEKADALNGSAPAVKLESLKEETKKAVETATDA